MKYLTLKQVWNLYKKPTKVRAIHWRPEEWFMLCGLAPGGEAYGYLDNGCGCGFMTYPAVWIPL